MSEESRNAPLVDPRRLVAIMFTDVAGYSARVQRDERTTLALVKADFARISELVAQQGGEVLDTMGDGMLLCFPSAVQAVACALQIQAEFNQRRERKSAEEALEHRIGIHVGDVVRQGGQVAGDGANIAARLQTKAPVGGICVSQIVRDTIRGKLAFQEEFLGPQSFKNIAEKIPVYSLTPPGRRAPPAKVPVMRKGLLFGLAAALAVIAVVVWRWPGRPSAAAGNEPAIEVTREKSIAVLPFINMSDNKENTYFADGMQEDILTNLALIGDLKVISRASVMQYRDTRKSLRQIGRELGAAYLLEGSVRRTENKVRVTGQLIDARTDEHVWANTYDRELTDIFAIQAELATEIASALKARLTASERMLIERRPTENQEAFDLFQKARAENLGTGKGQTEAEALLQKAVELDPKFVNAWVWLAWHHLAIYGMGSNTPERLNKARQALTAAEKLAPDDPLVFEAYGDYYRIGFRDYAKAEVQFQKALQLKSPRTANVLLKLGHLECRGIILPRR